MPGLSLKEKINKKVILYFGTFPIYDQHKPQITADSAQRVTYFIYLLTRQNPGLNLGPIAVRQQCWPLSHHADWMRLLQMISSSQIILITAALIQDSWQMRGSQPSAGGDRGIPDTSQVGNEHDSNIYVFIMYLYFCCTCSGPTHLINAVSV